MIGKLSGRKDEVRLAVAFIRGKAKLVLPSRLLRSTSKRRRTCCLFHRSVGMGASMSTQLLRYTTEAATTCSPMHTRRSARVGARVHVQEWTDRTRARLHMCTHEQMLVTTFW